jgi:tetratricopeptide (TPR) repeat protein
VDPEAYDEYLRAMNALGNRWMAGGCREAEPRLLHVVERDPSFAPALAALAWCYAYPDRLGRNVSEVVPKAKAAVGRALVLDDRLALAHAVDGTIKWRMDYDVAAGEAALGRALERDPSSGLVLMPSAEILLWRGQIERGLALLDRASRLDPLSPDRNVGVGFCLLMIGRYAAAIERFEHALVLDPQSLTARYWLAEAMGYAGRHDRAVAEYLSWLDGALHPALVGAVRRRLEDAYARGGWSAFWREELAVALDEVAHPGAIWARRGQERYTGAYHIARRQARLGRQEETLDALELAYEGRNHLMAVLGLDPLFEPLRPTARFQALLRKTGGVLGPPGS